MLISDLPEGSAPSPVALPHFPDRLHAYVWRNWELVPLAHLAKVVGAKPADILALGRAMGLPAPPRLHRGLRAVQLRIALIGIRLARVRAGLLDRRRPRGAALHARAVAAVAGVGVALREGAGRRDDERSGQ